jgi:hypothetical protein
MKQNEELKQPFFAKLLESQNVIPKQGGSDTYPTFTYLIIDGYHTLKYPSDNDEEGPISI